MHGNSLIRSCIMSPCNGFIHGPAHNVPHRHHAVSLINLLTALQSPAVGDYDDEYVSVPIPLCHPIIMPFILPPHYILGPHVIVSYSALLGPYSYIPCCHYAQLFMRISMYADRAWLSRATAVADMLIMITMAVTS